jgi:hypothetical protein
MLNPNMGCTSYEKSCIGRRDLINAALGSHVVLAKRARNSESGGAPRRDKLAYHGFLTVDFSRRCSPGSILYLAIRIDLYFLLLHPRLSKYNTRPCLDSEGNVLILQLMGCKLESVLPVVGRGLKQGGACLVLCCALAIGATTSHADAPYTTQRFDFQGLPVEFDGPAGDPVGVVYVFHGRGGGVGFLSRDVTQRTLRPLREAGFAIAGTESRLREPRSLWDTRDWSLTSNRDLQRLLALHAELTDRGWIGSETPVFTLGMSNGAFMAMMFAAVANEQGIDTRAVVAIQGGFRDDVLDEIGYALPTFYVLVANELLVNNGFVASGCDYLKTLGQRCELRMIGEQPLEPALLVRYGFDPEDAVQLLPVLMAQRWIDADGERAVPLDRYESADDWVVALAETGAKDPNALFQAFRHAWALHMMRDDYRDEQLAFLKDTLSENE